MRGERASARSRVPRRKLARRQRIRVEIEPAEHDRASDERLADLTGVPFGQIRDGDGYALRMGEQSEDALSLARLGLDIRRGF